MEDLFGKHERLVDDGKGLVQLCLPHCIDTKLAHKQQMEAKNPWIGSVSYNN